VRDVLQPGGVGPDRAAPWILAIDASTATSVVAVGRGGEMTAEHRAAAPRAYDEGLLPRIESVLAEAGVSIGEIGVFACGIGPGSFTGSRIALATAKGYVLALDRPLVTVSSTAATAAAAPAGTACAVVVLDAKRGQLHVQAFDLRTGLDGLRVIAEGFVGPGEAAAWRAAAALPEPVAWVGEAAGAASPPPDDGVGGPAAGAPGGACLLALAERARRAGAFADASSVEPVYLRPPPFHEPTRFPRGSRGSRGRRGESRGACQTRGNSARKGTRVVRPAPGGRR
jgi:tRNA threonylcarbamoyladenosine biosynthesis protein TsaB